METPDTHYAVRADGRSVAYQVFGQGPVDLVFCWGFISHLDLQWTSPDLARFFEQLSAFCRVIVFDKLGNGLSDPIDRMPTLEDRAQDVVTVMDAAGCERAAIFGESEAGPTAIVVSTMFPQRVSKLIIYGSLVMGSPSPEVLASMGMEEGTFERKWTEMDEIVDDWGKGRSLELLAPSVADNAMIKRSMGTYERSAISPSMARGIIGIYRAIDVTGILHLVTAPTLILHRVDDWVPVECGRYMSTQIPGARFVELLGTDHAFFVGDFAPIIRETQQFLTGTAPVESSERALLSVLFTDIVDSTAKAAALGDAAWRRLLEQHADVTSTLVAGSGGRVIKSTGDGILAVFPGPARAIACTESMVRALDEAGITIRAGIHTGECEVMGDDIGGLAVHVGARVAALAGPGEVLVSSTTKDLVIGSGLQFQDRGEHELKGVPDTWRLYAVGDRSTSSPLEPASAQMTLGDRLTVRVARRAPGALRAAARLALRNPA